MLVGQSIPPLRSGVYSDRQTDDAPTSPFTRPDAAVQRVAHAATQVDELADLLCGATPKAVENSSGKLTGAGLFEAMASAASDLEGLASRIEAAVSRIQNRLP